MFHAQQVPHLTVSCPSLVPLLQAHGTGVTGRFRRAFFFYSFERLNPGTVSQLDLATNLTSISYLCFLIYDGFSPCPPPLPGGAEVTGT